jgi:hypothetical protein
MNTIHIDPADTDSASQGVVALCRKAFPSYRGRSFAMEVVDGTLDLRSSWQGGSRDYYSFVRLDGQAVSNRLPAQSGFDRPVKGLDSVQLPDGTAVVEHSIFQGRDLGLTLMIGRQNATKMLPSPVTLPDDQLVVLEHTRSLKSTYGGVKNIRYREAHQSTGITVDRWDAAVASLMASKHLRRNKSITPKGRNACRSHGYSSC